MAEYQYTEFVQRLSRIGKNHEKLAYGHATAMGSDGLIVAVPRREKTHNMARSLFLCLIVMWAFKVFMHANLGAVAYQDRVSVLQNGTAFQRVGAYAMVADPVTVWFANFATSSK